jgi:hypothetical protein
VLRALLTPLPPLISALLAVGLAVLWLDYGWGVSAAVLALASSIVLILYVGCDLQTRRAQFGSRKRGLRSYCGCANNLFWECDYQARRG